MPSDTYFELITASRAADGPHSRWNQDASLVASARGETVDAGKVGRFPFAGGPVVLAVADGVGSIPERAAPARLALEAVIEVIRDRANACPPPDLLDQAFSAANRAVTPDGLSVEEIADLWDYGSTLTVALVDGLDAWIGHLGDSRAYLNRRGRLHRLTRDHRLVELMVMAGQITPEEARGHALRSVMLESLGARPDVRPSVVRLELELGDRLILCTDGVSDAVADEALAEAISKTGDAKTACVHVINAVLGASPTDNATVVVADVTGARRLEPAYEARDPVVSVIHDALASRRFEGRSARFRGYDLGVSSPVRLPRLMHEVGIVP